VAPTVAEIYVGLRGQVLGLPAVEVAGLPEERQLLAAVMDMAVGDAVATLVGVADGSTSMYFSTGGGVIGAGQHDAVRTATERWLEACIASAEPFAPVIDPPLPDPGTIQLILVTRVGLAHALARENELGPEHRLWPLYAAAQEVITQIRLVEGGSPVA
jgi:hypothetical protein